MLPHTGSIAFRRRSSLRGILLSSSSSCEETYVHFMPHRNSGYIAPFQRRSIHKNSETPRYVSWGLKELPDTKHVQNILKREHHIPESRLSAPQPIVHGPLELIHADTHIAVISKPSGMMNEWNLSLVFSLELVAQLLRIAWLWKSPRTSHIARRLQERTGLRVV